MMKIVAVLLVTLSALVCAREQIVVNNDGFKPRDGYKASKIEVSYSNCTKSNAQATLTSLVFTPNPPLINQNFSAAGKGVLKEDVTAGTFDAKITVLGIPIDEETGDICKPDTIVFPLGYGYLYFLGLECPVKQGPMELQLKAEISSTAPDDKVKVVFNAYDQQKRVIICVDIVIKLSG